MNAMTRMKERVEGEGEEVTVKIHDGKEISRETFGTVLVHAEKVISKVLADLKRCSKESKVILRQML